MAIYLEKCVHSTVTWFDC